MTKLPAPWIRARKIARDAGASDVGEAWSGKPSSTRCLAPEAVSLLCALLLLLLLGGVGVATLRGGAAAVASPNVRPLRVARCGGFGGR